MARRRPIVDRGSVISSLHDLTLALFSFVLLLGPMLFFVQAGTGLPVPWLRRVQRRPYLWLLGIRDCRTRLARLDVGPVTVHVKRMLPTFFTAIAFSETIGICAGDVVRAARWDGSDSVAAEIIEWVEAHGGAAALSEGSLVVVDHGDLAFARPGGWIVHLRDRQFTSLGDSVIGRLFAPLVTATEMEHA